MHTAVRLNLYVSLGVIHISADAKIAHFGHPLADTMLTKFSAPPPLADSQHTLTSFPNRKKITPPPLKFVFRLINPPENPYRTHFSNRKFSYHPSK